MKLLPIAELTAQRIAAGIKLEEVAVELGYHPTTVSRWERHPTTVKVNKHIRRAWQTFLADMELLHVVAPHLPKDDGSYAQRCADKEAHDAYLKAKKEDETT